MAPVADEKVTLHSQQCLWKPNASHKTKLDEFKDYINRKYRLKLDTYDDLYRWSVEEYPSFWGSWWDWGGFVASCAPSEIVDLTTPMPQIPRWFTGAKLNLAENLLRFRDNVVALYVTGEGQSKIEAVSHRQLYMRTCQYAKALRKAGVKTGDRVAGYLPNGMVAVEAMLGVAAIGAIWSSASPDFGVTGVLERFTQIEPEILFSVEAVVYNGKVHNHLEKLQQVAAKLKPKKVVIAPFVKDKVQIDISNIQNSVFLDDFLSQADEDKNPFEFVQVPFHHPQFIMFSSGTTGVPKCIVHSVGGTLLQISKEHILHCDIDRSDVMMYYTTTGWMMWNWLVLGLFTGCSLVLYDGSPLVPTPSALWDLVDNIGITVLGTGAKWLSVLEMKGVKPMKTHNLQSLKAILSTGSPLSPSSFQYVYKEIKKDVMLGSISGGTDIISCFMGCNPTLPVYEGQIQCRLLGMAIESRDEEGHPVFDARGELVCTRPFPSMPVFFWKDPDNLKYFKAYFNKYPQIWTHGDFCIFHSDTSGITILGRSDGTLNPSGVRFGSSEIYNIVESLIEVQDSLCVSQRDRQGEERVILFVKLQSSTMDLSPELCKHIQILIRSQLSSRHVPSVILPIKDIPYTVSGKKVEIAVRQVIHGEKVQNKGSLANPDCLDLYKNLPQLTKW